MTSAIEISYVDSFMVWNPILEVRAKKHLLSEIYHGEDSSYDWLLLGILRAMVDICVLSKQGGIARYGRRERHSVVSNNKYQNSIEELVSQSVGYGYGSVQ